MEQRETFTWVLTLHCGEKQRKLWHGPFKTDSDSYGKIATKVISTLMDFGLLPKVEMFLRLTRVEAKFEPVTCRYESISTVIHEENLSS